MKITLKSKLIGWHIICRRIKKIFKVKKRCALYAVKYGNLKQVKNKPTIFNCLLN